MTERREPFLPWLRWNLEKQSFTSWELVLVASDDDDLSALRGLEVRSLTVPVGTPVPVKRNLALQLASAPSIAWFDDDDWQHPERLHQICLARDAGAEIVGSRESWFVSLQGRARHYSTPAAVIFNGAGFATSLARNVVFNERLLRRSDTRWLTELVGAAGADRISISDLVLSCWMCHPTNLSNPAHRGRFPDSIAAARRSIGSEAWDGTDEQIRQLARRLSVSAPAIES